MIPVQCLSCGTLQWGWPLSQLYPAGNLELAAGSPLHQLRIGPQDLRQGPNARRAAVLPFEGFGFTLWLLLP